MTPTVRRATLADLRYLTSLARRESEAIGFITAGAYEGMLAGYGPYAQPNHRIWLAEADGEPVGFLYASPGLPGGPAKVIQVCVQDDARRLEYASALVRRAEAWAASGQRSGVSCRVATDLEAGQFWDALAYEPRGLVLGGRRRRRILEIRYRPLVAGLLPNLAQEVVQSARDTAPHASRRAPEGGKRSACPRPKAPALQQQDAAAVTAAP